MMHSSKEDEVQHGPDTSGSGTGTSHGETIFVSNLAYSTNNSSLEAAFSNLAPIKSAFVVFRKGMEGGKSNVSAGVGYVTFAFKEDAESVLHRLESEPLLIDGRKVRAQRANKKPTGSDNHSTSNTPPSHKTISPDLNSTRTVVLSNIPLDISVSTFWKKIRKQDGAESVEWPVRHPVTGLIIPGVAYALFQSPTKAHAAISRLHAHIYKGSFLSAVLRKRATPIGRNGAFANAEPSKAGKLIVRNLPSNITENDLHALFSPYGPIYSINVPPTLPSSAPDKPRFAFVWMHSKSCAENAMKRLNGTKVMPGISARLAAVAANKHGKCMIPGGEPDDQQMAINCEQEIIPLDNSAKGAKTISKNETTLGDQADDGRNIAVDWALSKDKWEHLKATLIHGHEAQTPQEGRVGDNDPISPPADVGNGSTQQHSKRPGTSEPTGSSSHLDEGTTLFIRNVPFEASEEDLGMLFRRFGPVRYARITQDNDTGRSRGSGFVCFQKLADAEAAIAECEKVRAGSGYMATHVSKANPFSLLTPDPASSSSASLVLMGRTLDVVRAVDREHARRLKEQGEKAREKKDLRNLYLMREGVIFEGSKAAQSISPAEVERRMAAYNTRKQLVKSNPSLYVSRTRLSIRQLPVFVTERVLKRMGLYAIKSFDEEVRDSLREDLAADELAVDDPMAVQEAVAHQDRTSFNATSVARNKNLQHKKFVKQAKISRKVDRVDPLSGNGKSKGYGFLEMYKHGDALKVLRWLNNHESVIALAWTWWREELQDIVAKFLNSRSSGIQIGLPEADAIRLELIKKQLVDMDENEAPKGRPLIVEFSIENAIVNKRRAAREEGSKTAHISSSKDTTAMDGTGKKRKSAEADLNQRSSKRPKMLTARHPLGYPGRPKDNINRTSSMNKRGSARTVRQERKNRQRLST